MYKAVLQVSTDCVCRPGAVEWIQFWFKDCVYTPWDLLGFLVGLSSVFFWLIAQMPQFMTNILRQSAEALSPWFLFQWLAGDTLNLLGCVLTGDQLSTEVFTAYYFIFSDCLILSQFFYYQNRNKDRGYFSDDSVHKPAFGYHTIVTIKDSFREVGDCSSKNTETATKKVTHKKKPPPPPPPPPPPSHRFGIMARGERFQDFEDDKLNHQSARKSAETRRDLRRVILEYGLEYGPASISRLGMQEAIHVSKIELEPSEKHHQHVTGSKRHMTSKAMCLTGVLMGMTGKSEARENMPRKFLAGKKLLTSSSRVFWMKKTGAAFGIVSAGLYLGSRISQLLKNYQRKSAEGLSLAMVSFAVLANLTYGSAILIRLKSWEDFLSKAPWLMGSLGTVSLDIAIAIQARYFRSLKNSELPNERTPLLRV